MPWHALLTFWFGAQSEGLSDSTHRSQWFNVDAGFDDQCRTFESLVLAAAAGELDDWQQTPEGTLAFILLCDQLPRNLYRGSAQAYAFDELALRAATQGIDQGFDRELGWDQRAFFYMPFEHAEHITAQHTAVGLFAKLRDEVPASAREIFGNNLRFAHQHRDILLRFGRFPHRNPVLGRESSAAEIDFVAQGDGFGQLSPT